MIEQKIKELQQEQARIIKEIENLNKPAQVPESMKLLFELKAYLQSLADTEKELLKQLLGGTDE